METDSFFYRLLKQLPQTFFEMIGLPPQRARGYRFDSVEVKKAYRIDGLFLPKKPRQPLYFVEVQFQKVPTFYANLFAKVFAYLDENDPQQEWIAVAIFPSRSMEPEGLGPYQDLLQSQRVRRIYLDETPPLANPPLGLSIVQLVSAPVDRAKQLVAQVKHRTEVEFADSEKRDQVIELVEELLAQRFSQLTLEEVRKMFDLVELRKTRAWQKIHGEGVEEGRTLAKKELVHDWLAEGKSIKEIAALLKITVQEVRRLVKDATK